jgi:hypothetical protein
MVKTQKRKPLAHSPDSSLICAMKTNLKPAQKKMPFDLSQRDAFVKRIQGLGDSPFGPIAGATELRLEAADSIIRILIDPLDIFVDQYVAIRDVSIAEFHAGIRLLSALNWAVRQLRDVEPMTSDQAYRLSFELRGFWVEFQYATESRRIASIQAGSV